MDQWTFILRVAQGKVRREGESESAFAPFVLDGEIVNMSATVAAKAGFVHKPLSGPPRLTERGRAGLVARGLIQLEDCPPVPY